MCKAMDELMSDARTEGRAKGIAEGRAEGRIEGIIDTLADLVKKGMITTIQAAAQANMSVEEFSEKAGLVV